MTTPNHPTVLPTRSLFRATDRVAVEIRDLRQSAELTVHRDGAVLSSHPVSSAGVIPLGELEPGSYGISLRAGDQQIARSAVQIAGSGGDRGILRYAFVADYRPDRSVADLAAVADNLRRLHITGVQFYDWAYRHADLLGGGERYADALGSPVDLGTVRALIATCHEVGADALGYAAVYGVGNDEWPAWESLAITDADGTAYGLGDFLRLVDPGAPTWLYHFGNDLAEALAQCGFDGFHLDQYGYPKVALRTDGTRVDLTESFVHLIESVRERVPGARLVFNNVNDFPTWASAQAPQDAVYIEVWEPHSTHAALAQVIGRARSVAGGRPVVIAAYQQVYAVAPREEADRATALTMATVFSHGATHLLAGEADRILVDPYYVRNHVAEPGTMDLLARYYDFLTEHHDLLIPSGIVEVTGSYAASYNDDLDVSYAAATVSGTARPGVVWRRITAVGDALVVHLINLSGATDCRWDAPQGPPGTPGAGTLRMRRVGPDVPAVYAADPDASGHLEPLVVAVDGTHATVHLPPLATWQMIVVRSR